MRSLFALFANQRTKDKPEVWTISGRPEYVHQACDASLKRLGTEYIDLYYQHRVDVEGFLPARGNPDQLQPLGEVLVFRMPRWLVSLQAGP